VKTSTLIVAALAIVASAGLAQLATVSACCPPICRGAGPAGAEGVARAGVTACVHLPVGTVYGSYSVCASAAGACASGSPTHNLRDNAAGVLP
jgi:hypothetical protein